MQLPFLLADYLKGKTIYPSIRRFLNLLFSISISSFVFERFYFSYAIPNISDYKLIIDFFIRGYFVVPFCIFLLVHGITYLVPVAFFSIFNYRKSIKLSRKIVEYEIEKNNIERKIGLVRVLSTQFSSYNLNKNELVEQYVKYREYVKPEDLDKLETECNQAKETVELNFIFSFRAIVFVCIYFMNIAHFGWVLFSFSILCLITYMIILLIGYQLYDLLPTILRKFRYEADQYVEKYLRAKQE